MRSVIFGRTKKEVINIILNFIKRQMEILDIKENCSLFIMGSIARNEPTISKISDGKYLFLSDVDLLLISNNKERKAVGLAIQKSILSFLDEDRHWKCSVDTLTIEEFSQRLKNHDIYSKSAVDYHMLVHGKRNYDNIFKDAKNMVPPSDLYLLGSVFNLNVSLASNKIDYAEKEKIYDAIYHCLHKLAKSTRLFSKYLVSLGLKNDILKFNNLLRWAEEFINKPSFPNQLSEINLRDLTTLRDSLKDFQLPFFIKIVKTNHWESWLDDLTKASELNWTSDTNNILISNNLANKIEKAMLRNINLPRW